MKLSVRIRTARLAAGLSQAGLADQLGISRTAVANWESTSNRTRPSSERLEQVAHATDVSFEWLATGRGPSAAPDNHAAALDAELVEDPVERRLLQAFRNGSDAFRQALLVLLEQGPPARKR